MMKILVIIYHPKQVYILKNFIHIMIRKGHNIKILVVEKEMCVYLLEKFGIPFNLIGTNKPTLLKKFLDFPILTYRAAKIARDFKPDIFFGPPSPHLAIASVFRSKPYIVFGDTENANVVIIFALLFARTIINPQNFQRNLGKKQIKVNSLFEMAYLHPDYFTPTPSIKSYLGLGESEKYVIMRFVSWKAMHDSGHSGLSAEMKEKALSCFLKRCKVFISSEDPLPNKFEKYRIDIPLERMHDALYYSSLYFGESATMAAEASILGTPSVAVSTIAKSLGNFQELNEKYELIYYFDDGESGLKKALRLINNPDSKELWRKKAERFFVDKIDVTKYLIDLIENMKNESVATKASCTLI